MVEDHEFIEHSSDKSKRGNFMSEQTSLLVIGDVHTNPDYPNTRLEWLGKKIIESQFDIIVQVGDFADMGSLSSYDKGKRTNEGKRIRNDIASAHDGLNK